MLLAALDEAFDRKSWHGTNLRGSLRGLTADEASRRPGEGRHNVWEHVVHAAYWKYVVRRRLLREKRGSFPLKGSDWFVRPAEGAGDEAAWRKDVQLLEEMHLQLRATVALVRSDLLDEPLPGSEVTHGMVIRGVAAHDLYHTGQIQLIKRLVRQSL
jgi:uncharacterized damage-inducible protein DinB